ncbi:hypothetical protein DPMN_024688 [Dreissena polymorpha]|uniref:Uncharacterized protein n=1 Tax=Dreissena polymorpha TaxID=45954 RepID=A0A9D4LQ90_DREPO|nr:hypothetical protein DPMN_024688 [Dreissena polymorpha]
MFWSTYMGVCSNPTNSYKHHGILAEYRTAWRQSIHSGIATAEANRYEKAKRKRTRDNRAPPLT